MTPFATLSICLKQVRALSMSGIDLDDIPIMMSAIGRLSRRSLLEAYTEASKTQVSAISAVAPLGQRCGRIRGIPCCWPAG